MNDSSFKKTLSLNSISSAPRRPQKLGSVQSIVPDKSEGESEKNPSIFDEITLSDDEEKTFTTEVVKCTVCSKDMTSWMNSRRDIHVKVCTMKQAEKEKERRELRKLKTLTAPKEEQDVLEERSWELSKNNVKFARIAADDEENRKRKRPRSFAVVELAPKKCQCEVLTTLHTRFINEFHSKTVKKNNEGGVSEHAFQMKKMIEKLSRYEQLSSDMQKTMEDTADVAMISLSSSDGQTIKCHSAILRHRTSMMRVHPRAESIEVAQTRDVLKAWLTFVFTANIEWSNEEKDGVKELAIKYGPVGLEKLVVENEKTEVVEGILIEDSKVIARSQATMASSYEAEEAPDEVQAMVAEEPEDVVEEEQPPVDFYSSDNPLLGFGSAQEKVEDKIVDDEIILDDFPTASSNSLLHKSNATMDSFDEWSNQPANLPSTSTAISAVTPARKSSKPVFGSHVKILKTSGITPMPLFDNMDENELKERMKEIGLRPKGKKAMIQILKRAYATLHPEVCTGTPTIRPLIRNDSLEKCAGKHAKMTTVARTKTLSERISGSPKKTISQQPSHMNVSNDSGEIDVDTEADKTLNLSNDEREVGKICGDDVGEDEEDEDSVTASSGSEKSKDLSALKLSFLTWLRDARNSVLYEHILSLQPVSLEEMLVRLEKADGPLGRIGKGKLVKLLDMLRITYQLPQKPGRARAGGFKRKL